MLVRAWARSPASPGGAKWIRAASPAPAQTLRTVAARAATPRILPPRISTTEAEVRSTSSTRFDFSSMTLLSRMPAPVSTMIQRVKASPNAAMVGRRSFSEMRPDAALGENSRTSGLAASMAARVLGSIPTAARRLARITSWPASVTMRESERSPISLVHRSARRASGVPLTTTAASRRRPSGSIRVPAT